MSEPVYRVPPTVVHANLPMALNKTPWTRREEVMQPVWSAGVTGKGCICINLDTGYRPHPSLPVPKAVRNFTGSNRSDVTDNHGHGNHTIGSNVGRDGLSAAPEADLKVGKVLGDGGGGTNTTAGLEWAAKEEGDVVSCSWGANTTQVDSRTQRALEAIEESGKWIFFAAGNEGYRGWNTVGSPASSPNCVAVASVTEAGAPSGFSSGGPRVDVAAGGSYILSCGLKGNLVVMSGTSMACPTFCSDAILLRQTMKRLGMSVYLKSRGLVEFFKSENFLKDAGPVGRDPRYGEGISITSQNIINWIKARITEFA